VLEVARAIPPAVSLDLQASIARYLPLLVVVWTAGAFLLALRLAYGLAWSNRLGRTGSAAAAPWTSRLANLASRVGVTRAVMLKVSGAIDTPLAIGWWRPVVLLPAALVTNMSPGLLEALLAHELAHIRRHDYLVNLLQSVAEILLFYHPAVWAISRRIRVEREQIADDLAAEAVGEPERLALALQQLDRHQVAAFHPAQAASGGSLMIRIRRLVRPEPRPFAWKAALCALALSMVCAATAAISLYEREAEAAAAGSAPAAAGLQPRASTAPQAADANQMVTGQWSAKPDSGKRDEVHLQLTTDKGQNSWGTSFRIADLSGFDPASLTKDGAVKFALRRPAGTFTFEGRFVRGEGSGEFRLAPDATFVADMKSLGYPALSGANLFSLAMTGVATQFVRDMNAIGYRDIPLDKLIALAIHGATPEFARSMRGLLGPQVTLDNLVAMRIHGATPDFARDVQAQFGKNVTVDNLVALRIHGATPEFVRQMAASLGASYTVDQAVSMRIHDVTPEFANGMKQVLGRPVDVDQLVSMRIHGVTTEFAAKIRDLVTKDVTVDQLVSFRSHGVSPEFVSSMKAVGYDRITPDQLVSMRIHGVDAAFAGKARQNGKLPSIDDLISMKIHGRK
jgi:beta-lactamase regulating signal transducer with metallopeptidase domain